ncbi:FAD-binding oxidoreductase [Cellulomonas sp. APG4]|uniref:FAD-binding oxidoreductase n=1 Tax=Cellulomonas sp. APG4 TaxID=1538656 RepID=UPI00137B923F|nr:FAD-binding oxidoreductase [Cellulomonas sp. APG4]NCT91829.1 FAD-binding oxidoreductase [Cellulomonas sp. APG4]
MSAPAGTERFPVDTLRTRLSGRVLIPGDPEYDDARLIALGGLDPSPAAIARPVHDDDVAAVVSFAREHGVPLAVRGGGHSGAAHGTVNDGLVLDLRDMTALDVDADARTVWADAGLTAGDVTKALSPYGLAVGFGDTATVGIGGITLGGGVGFLSRRYGLTIDNLLAADVVTADGQVRRVSADHEPELFWGIRGGGGNFGVVTRFQLRLEAISQVVGGMLLLRATSEALAAVMVAAQNSPEELSPIVNVMPCPPIPGVPAEHHGTLVIMCELCAVGSTADGEAAVAPFRAAGEVLLDGVAPRPYAELFAEEGPAFRPVVRGTSLFLDAVDADLAVAIMERLEAADGMRVVQLRPLGGAIARVPADATAYAHRDRRLMGYVAAILGPGEDAQGPSDWVAGTADLLRQGDDGVYVNFLFDEGHERVRAAYPGATWDRLTALKARVDPTNLFRRNQNIPPAR